MPSLSVRRLDEDTLSRLRIRAAQHGVSMEEEARRILKDAVSPNALNLVRNPLLSRKILQVFLFKEHQMPIKSVTATTDQRTLLKVI